MSDNPYTEFTQRFRDDRVGFVKHVWEITPEHWQAEALTRLDQGVDRLSVRSGRGVGKTAFDAWTVLHFACTRYPFKVMCTAPSAPQLEDALWPELMTWYRRLPPPLHDLFGYTSDRFYLKASPEDAFVSARTARSENVEAIQGLHSLNSLLLVDEASGVHDKIFEAISGSLSDFDATMILTSNPTKRSGYFYQTQTEWADIWSTMKVSCFDSTRVNPKYIDEKATLHGTASAIYHVQVLGEFPPAEEDTFIPHYLVKEAMDRNSQVAWDAPVVWGVDVGFKGQSESVLAKRRGNKVMPLHTWKGLGHIELAARIKGEYEATSEDQKPSVINIDAIGFGGPLSETLQRQGLPVVPIYVTDATALDSTYHKLRDELWGKTREQLETSQLDLPDDDILLRQLTAPGWDFSTGKVVIESKKKMKARGVESPDRADAVNLTNASEFAQLSGLTRFGFHDDINEHLDTAWV